MFWLIGAAIFGLVFWIFWNSFKAHERTYEARGRAQMEDK